LFFQMRSQAFTWVGLGPWSSFHLPSSWAHRHVTSYQAKFFIKQSLEVLDFPFLKLKYVKNI
jgi:hypothetical protein